jgi:tRNA(fMet)-specific endonuclease VapC
MATFILDTGILVGYARGAPFAAYVDRTFGPSTPPNSALISIVTEAEIRSFATKNKWGERKTQVLDKLLLSTPTVSIEHPAILTRFAEIDAYNEGKHPTKELPGSAHKMGDNDIWIAATASVINARLLTTDHDFDHLHGVFLDVIYVDPHQQVGDAR